MYASGRHLCVNLSKWRRWFEIVPAAMWPGGIYAAPTVRREREVCSDNLTLCLPQCGTERSRPLPTMRRERAACGREVAGRREWVVCGDNLTLCLPRCGRAAYMPPLQCGVNGWFVGRGLDPSGNVPAAANAKKKEASFRMPQFVKKRGRGGALLRPWPFAM